MSFQLKKYEKYLNSKNDIKKPVRAFINELRAIYVFFKSSKILKPGFYVENGIKNIDISDRLLIRKTVDELVNIFKLSRSKK